MRCDLIQDVQFTAENGPTLERLGRWKWRIRFEPRAGGVGNYQLAHLHVASFLVREPTNLTARIKARINAVGGATLSRNGIFWFGVFASPDVPPEELHDVTESAKMELEAGNYYSFLLQASILDTTPHSDAYVELRFAFS